MDSKELTSAGAGEWIFFVSWNTSPKFFLLFYHMSHPTHTNYTLSMQWSLFLIQLASITDIISHSYTKISQTRNQFPMHPLKTIRTVKMAWHNRGKRSGTTVENALAHNELSLAVQGHWHLFFSQSIKFWVSSGSISSRKKLSFSRLSLRWSKPRSHRLQQEKCRPLRFSIWAQLTATSIEVPLCSMSLVMKALWIKQYLLLHVTPNWVLFGWESVSSFFCHQIFT